MKTQTLNSKNFENDFERDIDDFDDVTSVKTNNNVVLLWDILKSKFRKSEEQELARIIGNQLLQNGEDLRDEYQNFYEIFQDIQESKQHARAQQEIQENIKAKSSLFSTGGNQQFLNQELMIFIGNLQQKAVESGLAEDSLIPKQNEKDKLIFEYIKENMGETMGGSKSRPQSAMTGLSSTQSNIKFNKQDDPAGIDATMRGSFYSSKTGGFYDAKEGVVDSLKVKNVLELSNEDKKALQQIRDFMQEQQDGLQAEIDEMKKMIYEENTDEKKPLASAPSQKDLKDYSTKLQAEYLQSDQLIKQQKALSSAIPTDHRGFVAKDRISALPTPVKGIGSNKLASLTEQKPPVKDRTLKINKGPIKIKAANVDLSPNKTEDTKPTNIIKLKMKRQDSAGVKRPDSASKRPDSATRQPVKRSNSKTQILSKQDSTSGIIKMKLKVSKKPKVIKKEPEKEELYGLDLDFLQSMGLGDMIDDITNDEPEKKASEEMKEENMSIEQLRQQYDTSNTNKAPKKLRGLCQEYNDYYQQYEELDDINNM